MTTIDDDLPLSIIHSRDRIIFDGKVDQDYRFLTYRFSAADGEVEARVYLDDLWRIAILAPNFDKPVPDEILAYMRSRFRLITKLGGQDGYTVIWEHSDAKRLSE